MTSFEPNFCHSTGFGDGSVADLAIAAKNPHAFDDGADVIFYRAAAVAKGSRDGLGHAGVGHFEIEKVRELVVPGFSSSYSLGRQALSKGLRVQKSNTTDSAGQDNSSELEIKDHQPGAPSGCAPG